MLISMPSSDRRTLLRGVRFAACALALVLSLSPLSAGAWGNLGHQAVARIAQAQLSPKAMAGVNRLLALEPGATLASVSTWADEHRGASTARWHYVNLPKETCSYEAARDCPDGQCVVEAIPAQLRILSSEASDAARLLALKYVVHLFADVHQPLHAGHAEDRGGNQYQIQAQGRGSNLHAYWDSGLILESAADVDTLLARLRADVAAATASSASAVTDPAVAARESCQIVAAQGFYPPRKLPAAYVETYQPVMQQRLALAGLRLAAALNAAFK